MPTKAPKIDGNDIRRVALSGSAEDVKQLLEKHGSARTADVRRPVLDWVREGVMWSEVERAEKLSLVTDYITNTGDFAGVKGIKADVKIDTNLLRGIALNGSAKDVEKLLWKFGDSRTADVEKSAMYWIKAGVRWSERERAEKLSRINDYLMGTGVFAEKATVTPDDLRTAGKELTKPVVAKSGSRVPSKVVPAPG